MSEQQALSTTNHGGAVFYSVNCTGIQQYPFRKNVIIAHWINVPA